MCEKRSKELDIDLYLLAFCLHPKYRGEGVRLSFQRCLCRAGSIGKAMGYTADQCCICPALFAQTKIFKKDLSPYNLAFNAGKETPILWWSIIEDKTGPFLSRIATRIMRLVPSSASVERHFSTLGWLKNKYRNRLSIKNLEMMAAARSAAINMIISKGKKNDATSVPDGDTFIESSEVLRELGEDEPCLDDVTDNFEDIIDLAAVPFIQHAQCLHNIVSFRILELTYSFIDWLISLLLSGLS